MSEENGTARLQDCVKLAQHLFSLDGTQGAEVAHDHQDEMKTIICFKIQVVLIYIMDRQPIP